MDELYRKHILDHYKEPRNWGSLTEPTHSAFSANASCGDELSVQLQIKDGIVQEVAFNGSGCAISIATMSMLLEKIKGKRVSELELSAQSSLELAGLDERSGRAKCATLSYDVLSKALKG